MAAITRKWSIVILALGIVALLGLLPFDHGKPPPPPPLPNPNGYDDFVKAGQIVYITANDLDNPSQERLRTFVSKNAEALKLARLGLTRQCRVPIEYSQGVWQTNLSSLPDLKSLAHALLAEGKLAEMDDRQADAVRSYLDCIHLGRESARGGVIIHKLMGVAIETIGSRPLRGMLDKLPAQVCREITRTLETFEPKNEPVEDLLKRDAFLSRRTNGLRGQFVRLLSFKRVEQYQEQLSKKIKGQQKQLRFLLIDLAARAYELEKGERPKNLSDLVPAYLKAIPQDPFTGTNIVYQP